MRLKLLAVFLFYSACCSAQNMLRLTHLNVENGLSQSSVYSICQDAYGFIWMATGDGLNRFDGYGFISYKSKLNNNLKYFLKDRNINSPIYSDSRDNLWFAADEGVYYMHRHTGQFEVKLNKNRTIAQAVTAGPDGDFLWCTVPGMGVYRLPVQGNDCDYYPFTDSAQSSGGDIVPVRGAAVSRNVVWILDWQGLIRFDKKTHTDRRVLWRRDLNKMIVLKSGDLLLSGHCSVHIYHIADGTLRTITVRPGGLDAVDWGALAEDTVSGYVYIGEMAGGKMCRVDPTSGRSELFAFQKSNINWLFVDRSQNLWIGTEGDGAYRLAHIAAPTDLFVNIC